MKLLALLVAISIAGLLRGGHAASLSNLANRGIPRNGPQRGATPDSSPVRKFWNSKFDNVCDYKFDLENLLGEGGYGQAFLVDYKGRPAVLKTVPNDIDNELTNKQFENEVKIHKRLQSHPNIVSLIGYCSQVGHRKILLSYVSGGGLFGYLSANNWGETLSYEMRFKILKGLASALRFVEKQGLLHNDAHLNNVLLESDGTVKLADFGFASRRDPEVPADSLSDIWKFCEIVGFIDKTFDPPEKNPDRAGQAKGPSDPRWFYNLQKICLKGEHEPPPNAMKVVYEYLLKVQKGRVQRGRSSRRI